MVTLREFPNRTFKSKEDAFSALKEHEVRLISLKCARIQKSIDKLEGFNITPFLDVSKLPDLASYKTEPWVKKDHIYPVINTTKYFDNHGDVHFDGIWKRSIKANVGKLHYVEAHVLKMADIIAWPEDVTAFTKQIPWWLVNKNYSGNTEGLIFEIPKDAIVHDAALKVIQDKRPMENSVRMQYVKAKMAINSTSRDLKENKELYDERIDLIANKDQVEEFGYFFAVDEAKIIKEGSMVIAGSNDATAIVYDTEESAKGTSSPGTGSGHSDDSETEKHESMLTYLI